MTRPSSGIRCRYFDCPAKGQPIRVDAGVRETHLCEAHARMVTEAEANSYRLSTHGDADGKVLMEAIRLVPSFLPEQQGVRLRQELRGYQRDDHQIVALNAPGLSRLGAAKDEAQCKCGWAGFYDMFPLHLV